MRVKLRINLSQLLVDELDKEQTSVPNRNMAGKEPSYEHTITQGLPNGKTHMLDRACHT